MMNLKTVSALLKRHQTDLHQRGVKSLAVFGSLARDEATPASDIDVLVEFDRPVGLFDFIRLKLYLEELTGRRVDLVTPDALRPAMRAEILSEAIRVAWAQLENARKLAWLEMRGMRNIMAHEYSGVSLPIIRQAIEQDLNPLAEGLEKLLKS
jgi:uncharacterized protein